MHGSRRDILALGAALTVTGSLVRPASARAAEVEALVAYDARLRGAMNEGLSLSGLSRDLQEATNRFRAGRGLGLLRPHDDLAAAAQAQAADLGLRNYFEHTSPEGFTSSERVGLLARRFCGYTGENLAMRSGGSEPLVAERFLQMWIDSPGHRANLERQDYTHAGHGVIRIGDRVHACAVYGCEAARLAADLPLRPAAGELGAAMSGAEPALKMFQLSALGAAERSGPWPAARPALPQGGAWRLRPWLHAGGGRFDVLWGPLFLGET